MASEARVPSELVSSEVVTEDTGHHYDVLGSATAPLLSASSPLKPKGWLNMIITHMGELRRRKALEAKVCTKGPSGRGAREAQKSASHVTLHLSWSLNRLQGVCKHVVFFLWSPDSSRLQAPFKPSSRATIPYSLRRYQGQGACPKRC